MTNVIKTSIATPHKDIWNPEKHTKYFTDPKKLFGKEFTSRSIEDIMQQMTSSWMDYSIKSQKYIEFNPDRLWYPDGTPYTPSFPPYNPPYDPYVPPLPPRKLPKNRQQNNENARYYDEYSNMYGDESDKRNRQKKYRKLNYYEW